MQKLTDLRVKIKNPSDGPGGPLRINDGKEPVTGKQIFCKKTINVILALNAETAESSTVLLSQNQ